MTRKLGDSMEVIGERFCIFLNPGGDVLRPIF